MIPRKLSGAILKFAKKYPVVSVTGPRQSGKTTLVRSLFPEHKYLSLENPETRSIALTDPSRKFISLIPDWFPFFWELKALSN